MYLILSNVYVLKIREKKRKEWSKEERTHKSNSVSIFNAFRIYMAFERIKNMKVYLLAKNVTKTKNISTDIHMSKKRTSAIFNHKFFHRYNYIS